MQHRKVKENSVCEKACLIYASVERSNVKKVTVNLEPDRRKIFFFFLKELTGFV